MMINSIDTSAPMQMMTPIGPHSGVSLMTIGMTPIEAAIEVRNTGQNRRLADSSAASLVGCSCLSSSA